MIEIDDTMTTRKVLIVVDMLKDFIDKDGALYIGKTGDAIVKPIIDKVIEARKQGYLVIFLCDSHREDDKEFERFPKHAVTGTTGAELINGLSRELGDLVITKTRYSGFYRTELERYLAYEKMTAEANGVDVEVEVVGCCTSICVMDTVGGLANRDFNVTVFKNMVADFDQEAHEASLKRMELLYGATIVYENGTASCTRAAK